MKFLNRSKLFVISNIYGKNVRFCRTGLLTGCRKGRHGWHRGGSATLCYHPLVSWMRLRWNNGNGLSRRVSWIRHYGFRRCKWVKARWWTKEPMSCSILRWSWVTVCDDHGRSYNSCDSLLQTRGHRRGVDRPLRRWARMSRSSCLLYVVSCVGGGNDGTAQHS